MSIDIDARLDNELAAVRARYATLGFDLKDLAGTRAVMSKMAERAQLPAGSSVRIEMSTAQGSNGTVNVRLFRPSDADDHLPALLWIHGGGFVMGSAADTDRRLGEICDRVGCVVVSVDYRLAPEHPYPAGLDDCVTALTWLRESAEALGIDRERIAIGGASAGAGLTAALALRLRDQTGDAPAFQLLIYPMLDDRNESPSSLAITDPSLWNRQTNLLAWSMYLGDAAGTEDIPLYAAPARAANLAHLPPAFIAVGDLDLFLDEDISYAQRLLQAGVPTELHVYPGAIHGFDMLAPAAAVSCRLNNDVETALRAALGNRK